MDPVLCSYEREIESSMETMTPAACEIARLPEELLLVVLSRTTPRDACRAAAVSHAFRVAADSDAVWSCFLPLAGGEVKPVPPSTKALFMRLSARPVLLHGGLMSMWLDRLSGAKCYMLSARALHILGADTPQWSWINLLRDSRFNENAVLQNIRLLKICGTIDSKMLSRHSTYAAYMVFGTNIRSYGLWYPDQEASVNIGEMRSTSKVCLGGLENTHWHTVPTHVRRPRRRGDGWLEVEMGRFYNEDGNDGEVSISLTETSGNWKQGLILEGIEIRAEN